MRFGLENTRGRRKVWIFLGACGCYRVLTTENTGIQRFESGV